MVGECVLLLFMLKKALIIHEEKAKPKAVTVVSVVLYVIHAKSCYF